MTAVAHQGDAWAAKNKAAMLAKRYHVRNDYTGATYEAYDDLYKASLSTRRKQGRAVEIGSETTWYVVDTTTGARVE